MEIGKENAVVQRMEREAIHELLHYHEKSPRQRLKDMVKRAAGRYVPPRDMLFWPAGMLANALMERPSREKTAAVREYFDIWIAKGMPLYYLDDTLCGVALLKLYQITGEEKYKCGADQMLQYLFRLEQESADAAGSIPYRPLQKNDHVYVDGIGMMCPFLAMYGAEYGDDKAVQTALTQIENMLEYGMDTRTGLPYHGFKYENRIKYGIIGWGRAVGWLLMGIGGVHKALSSNRKERYLTECRKLEAVCVRLLDAVRPWIKDSGGFAWQLQAAEGPEDSSATAMIAGTLKYALGQGFWGDTMGMEQEEWERLLQRMLTFLEQCEQDGRVGQCLGECMGFAQYPQVYGAYPWSLGAAMEVME